MLIKEAKEIIVSLSRPSKMPGLSYSLPAATCKTGSKLAQVEGSTCYNCYAKKGCYVFSNVQEVLYKRQAATRHPLWVRAMVASIWKTSHMRWHDSGDVQDLKHLAKIFKVARLTPHIQHWMPTREAWIKKYLNKKPDNLVIRFSAAMVDGDAPASWPNTSTVVTNAAQATCPAPQQDNKCLDCRKCWDPKIKNVAYHAH